VSTVAPAADGGETCPRFGHVACADLARNGDRRLLIRHSSRLRREGPLAVARAIPHGRRGARTLPPQLLDQPRPEATVLPLVALADAVRDVFNEPEDGRTAGDVASRSPTLTRHGGGS
jgi:hypothetical protein